MISNYIKSRTSCILLLIKKKTTPYLHDSFILPIPGYDFIFLLYISNITNKLSGLNKKKIYIHIQIVTKLSQFFHLLIQTKLMYM